jgi:hypothetical protein
VPRGARAHAPLRTGLLAPAGEDQDDRGGRAGAARAGAAGGAEDGAEDGAAGDGAGDGAGGVAVALLLGEWGAEEADAAADDLLRAAALGAARRAARRALAGAGEAGASAALVEARALNLLRCPPAPAPAPRGAAAVLLLATRAIMASVPHSTAHTELLLNCVANLKARAGAGLTGGGGCSEALEESARRLERPRAALGAIHPSQASATPRAAEALARPPRPARGRARPARARGRRCAPVTPCIGM